MAYIGAQPNKTLTKTTSQSFNGTGSATVFTLNRVVNTEEELEVFVENVQQEPGSGKSYTASGTTLTFDEAPPSGTGNVYVIYRGLAEVTTRLEHDANQALSATTGTFSGAVSGTDDICRAPAGTDGTFTGDLTVDTSTLKVDSSNNRVGIGSATPAKSLDVNIASATMRVRDAAGGNDFSVKTIAGPLSLAGSTVNTAIGFMTNDTERMRIGTSGDVFFNQSSTSSPGLSNTTQGAVISDTGRLFSSVNGAWSLFNRNTDNGDVILFRRSGSGVGSISVTTSSTSYNTSSDHRLKENVADMTGAIARVKQLAPKRFNFIADPDDTTVDGFLAHEAQTVVPEAVTGTHNGLETWTQREIDDGEAPDGTSAGDNKLDGDGNTIPEMQGIDQAKLVPLLTGALKEAITKIETLEAKVAALEGN